GYQAEGAAPIVRGAPVAEPETVATAIRIGNPASWKGAVAARDESGGAIDAVTDSEILDAYSFLARCEGVFAEPASAAAIAGLRVVRERRRGERNPRRRERHPERRRQPVRRLGPRRGRGGLRNAGLVSRDAALGDPRRARARIECGGHRRRGRGGQRAHGGAA